MNPAYFRGKTRLLSGRCETSMVDMHLRSPTVRRVRGLDSMSVRYVARRASCTLRRSPNLLSKLLRPMAVSTESTLLQCAPRLKGRYRAVLFRYAI